MGVPYLEGEILSGSLTPLPFAEECSFCRRSKQTRGGLKVMGMF